MERERGSKTPSIIDLDAELAKLTMFRGLTPQTKRAERRGSGTQLGPYRDGILIAGKSAGTSHWETHPDDELVHVLDGRKTLEIVCDDGPPKSFVLHAGMIAIVPRGARHRFHSAEGGTTWSATLPGDHIALDVNDPRTVAPEIQTETRTPSIVDLDAEVAKLTLFQRTPQLTAADCRGSVAQLASYRDGLRFAFQAAGTETCARNITGDS